jgi:hypothetical protein
LNKTPLLCAMAVAALFAAPAEAIYKCTTPKGVIYQDRPCREGTESDVQIVIPTGELMQRPGVSQDEGAQPNPSRPDSRAAAGKAGRAPADDASAASRAAGRATNETVGLANEDARKKDGSVPMTAEQARKTEPSAKYYTTDAAAPGTEVPEQMTCESPTGEKRKFILANGKLTSI